MATKRVDRYSYTAKDPYNKSKVYFYEKMMTSDYERDKTKALVERLDSYVKLAHDSSVEEEFNYQNNGEIKFKGGIGYFLLGNYDKDVVCVDFLGATENIAFNNAIMHLESVYATQEYSLNVDKYEKEYIPRLMDEYLEANRYHALIYSELAMKNIRKYYAEEVPQQIINEYIDYILNIDRKIVKYDYNTNKFIKADLKIRKLEK